MDKRTSRAFRPASPSPLEERLAPGNFLGDVGHAFGSIGRAIASPYERLGNAISGAGSATARNPTYSSGVIRRWTVIARVMSGEISPPAPPTPMTPFAPPPPPMMPDAA